MTQIGKTAKSPQNDFEFTPQKKKRNKINRNISGNSNENHASEKCGSPTSQNEHFKDEVAHSESQCAESAKSDFQNDANGEKCNENSNENHTMNDVIQNFQRNFPIATPKSEDGFRVKKGFDHKQVLSRMFEDNHLDNPFIEDDPSLSKEENRLRKDSNNQSKIKSNSTKS